MSTKNNKLKRWLFENQVSSREFALRAGISEIQVSKYKNGSQIPSPNKMKKIICVTKGEVMPNDFFDINLILDEWLENKSVF